MGVASFFDEVAAPTAPRGRREVSEDTLREAQCTLCPLDNADIRSPKMGPAGPDDATAYVLGEAPGRAEDERGKPFVGKSGRMLRDNLAQFESYRVWNTIRCRPPDNATPGRTETECCRRFIEKDVEAVSPERILLVGAAALRWATGNARITKHSGTWVPVRIGTHEAWGLPVIHPAAVMRNPKLEGQFLAALARFEAGPPAGDPGVVDLAELDGGIVGDPGRADVRALAAAGTLAFDIETHSDESGHRMFRPYSDGARILSMGISDGERTLVSVGDDVGMMVAELAKAGCSLVAHNLPFDMEWLWHFHPELATANINWHCTKAMIYVLDGSRGGNALDELAEVYLGIRGFKAASGVDVENLAAADRALLIRYNGRDAAATHHLARRLQDRLRDEGMLRVYRDQRRRILPAVAAQLVGFPVDVKAAGKLHSSLAAKVRELSAAIVDDPDARAHGLTNPDSVDQVVRFAEGIGESGSIASDSRKGGKSVDDRALRRIKHPVAGMIRQRRALAKIDSTYVKSLRAGDYVYGDGRVHMRYNTSDLVSRRTSCDSPNIQNQPKRGEHAKLVRQLFRAPEGHTFLSMDYGQIEARVVAMASNDDRLVEIMWDRYDIHSDWAERICAQHPNYVEFGEEYQDNADVRSAARTRAKGWVFGNLFGQTVKGAIEHLGAGEELARSLYWEFWSELPGVRRWHEALAADYEAKGYVELLTGFRRRGPMRYNEVINTPIQGTASDIVMDCWCRLREEAIAMGRPWLLPPVQIHDDLTFVVPDDEIQRSVEVIKAVAFSWSEDDFPWINVPLSVEFASGKDWAAMRPLGEFYSDEEG